MENQIIQYFIGFIFIVLYAYNSYSTPGKNHSLKFIPLSNLNLTTSPRFFLFFTLYSFILIVIYSFICIVLSYAPGICDFLPMFFDPKIMESVSTPIAAALVITTVLPSIPLTKSYHEQLLSKLWDMGMIPTQALAISENMGKANYQFNQNIKNEVTQFATSNDLDPDKINYKTKDSRSFEWAQVHSLIWQIDQWKYLKGYGRFLENHYKGFEDIKKHYVIITGMFKRYQYHSENLHKANSAPNTLHLLNDLDEQLKTSSRNMIRKTCQFIATALLTVCSSHSNRTKAIKNLGFIYTEEPKVERPPWPAALLILFCIFVTNALITHLNSIFTSAPLSIEKLVEIAIQMTVMYITAIFTCIELLKRSRSLIIEREIEKVITDTLVIAILSTILSYLLILTYQSFFVLISEKKMPGFDELPVNIYHWPFLFQVFLLSTGILIMCNRIVIYQKDQALRERTIDALAVGMLTGIGGIICYIFKYKIGFDADSATTTRLMKHSNYLGKEWYFIWFFLKAVALGVIAGYIVPPIYRKNMVQAPGVILKRNLRDDIDELTMEIKAFKKDEIIDALSIACAYVSSSDGSVGEQEKKLCRRLIIYLKDNNIIEIPYHIFSEAFDKYARQFMKLDHDLHDNLSMQETLKKFHESYIIKRIIVLLCISVASADGFICHQEKKAIEDIAKCLRLNTDIDELVNSAAAKY